MLTISELEARISEATQLLEGAEKKAASSPSADLSATSLRAQIKELQAQLRAQKQRRVKEVVEVRLQGEQAALGSLPLGLLGRITTELASALGHTARMWHLGSDGRVTQDIEALLDLRLEGIGEGSTKLFITGETAPDIFGRSLIEETLRETFGFCLASQTSDELAGAVGSVGSLASKAFERFFSVVGRAGLGLGLTWESPSEQEMHWSAEAWKVRQIATVLKKLVPDEPEEVGLTGEIITVSERRPLEIRGSDGIEYTIRVPAVMANDLKGFTIGQEVAISLERQTVRNHVTGLDKTTLTLVRISAV